MCRKKKIISVLAIAYHWKHRSVPQAAGRWDKKVVPYVSLTLLSFCETLTCVGLEMLKIFIVLMRST